MATDEIEMAEPARTVEQMRAQKRLAEAIVAAFMEAVVEEVRVPCDKTVYPGDELVWDGSEALIQWAQEAWGVDLRDLVWGNDEFVDEETWVARGRLEELVPPEQREDAWRQAKATAENGPAGRWPGRTLGCEPGEVEAARELIGELREKEPSADVQHTLNTACVVLEHALENPD